MLFETTPIVVFALFTVSERTDEVLPLKFASPPYTAVKEWTPVLKVEIASDACPEPFRLPEPIVVVSSLNITVPVGMPVSGSTTTTVVVSVTD